MSRPGWWNRHEPGARLRSVHRHRARAEVSEQRLNARERRERRGLRPQNAWTEPADRKPMLLRQRDFSSTESALGSNEQGQRRDAGCGRQALQRARERMRARWVEQQARAGAGRLDASGIEAGALERLHGAQLRNAVAAALLASGDGD